MRYTLSLVFAALLLLFALPTGAQMTSAECLGCHEDPKLAKDVKGKPVSVHVNKDLFAGSIHGGIECTDCHNDISEYPHPAAVAKVDCASCHPDAQAAHEVSVHKKSPRGPTCADCHGDVHAIVPKDDPKSAVHRSKLTNTCGKCHGQKFVMEPSGFSTQPFFSYQQSVHGRAVAGGSLEAALCTDCHNSHDVRPANDPESPIFKSNVPKTCGKCHGVVSEQFVASIHGQAAARGNSRSPVCTDCHGIHTIKSHIDPTSSVSKQALARTTCTQCHGGVRLTSEFGVKGKRVSSYEDSYHGLAAKMGSAVAANCASCHGVHNIFPSSDSRSTTHKANLVKTCGTCHPGAGENFIQGEIHLDAPAAKDPGGIGVRWIRFFYLWIIWLTIGGMAAHNILIWARKAIEKRRRGDRVIVRMTRQQQVQHALLVVSFIVLVITGFALIWPESWLAAALGNSESFRRWGHRVAAVVMLLVGVYHLIYLAATREGRKAFRDMLPNIQDARDVVMNMGFYLGLTKQRPQFARFSYMEKAEYWALIWGTFVMGLTGIMLWWKVGISQFVPRWWIDIALAIHFYEAILATLAIIVWHLYAVIFDPDLYPMNWAWYDGKMTTEEYRHEHPAAYKEWLAEQGKNEEDDLHGHDSHGHPPKH